jgi:hypothetical protein
MCFHVTSPLSIAEQDIPCYKVMKLRYNKKKEELYLVSFFQDYHYTSNEPPSVDLYEHDQMVYAGYYSFINKKDDDTYCYYSNLNRTILTNFIIDGFLELNSKHTYHPILVECYIPKGSHYYMNARNNEYVSSRIVIDWLVLLNHFFPLYQLSFDKIREIMKEAEEEVQRKEEVKYVL